VKKATFALAALFILFLFATRVHLGSILPLSISLAQTIAFPFVVLLLWNVNFGTWYLPRLLLLGAVAGAMIGAGVAYGPPPDHSGTFVVARFPSDTLETDSRIFREKITNYLRGSSVSVVRSYEVPQSFSEAAALFRHRLHLRPLVWGNRRWLSISFPEELRTPAKLIPVQEIERFFSLTPVTHVSIIGLSLMPEGDTAQFVALLFRGLLEGEGGHETDLLWESRMTYLQEAANHVHAWSASLHRGYPLWQLGNYHLAQAFRGPKIQRQELLCALSYYRVGASLVPSRSNLELSAALLNNEAIALRILGKMRGKKNYLKRSRRLLQEAAKYRRPDASNAELIVRGNLEKLAALRASLRLARKQSPSRKHKRRRR
jgi:hypothetical protein